MFNSDSQEWAQLIFGNAQLGDPRRTKRLIKLAADMAGDANKSVVRASSDPASIEGAYRFIRNESISPDAIAQAGFEHTAQVVEQRPVVLALQDTTGLSYRHSVCDELGNVNSGSNSRPTSRGRTLYAHSTLMLDAEHEQVLGLANQQYWFREEKKSGNYHQRQLQPRETKESFKWQANVEHLMGLLTSMDNIIDVCDREADIFDYLDFQKSHQHRFVVRASDNRRLENEDVKLFEAVDKLSPITHSEVYIQQRGGRKARTAKLSISCKTLQIKKPRYANGAGPLSINTVVCQEVGVDESQKPLRWILYTSEPIETAEQVKKVIRYYELRWRIEEFHKIWKSDGTQVDKLRMQTKDNLLRIAILKAFIAVRLFQLREMVQERETSKSIPCSVYLSDISWKILWKRTNKGQPIPKEVPSLHWAYYAIAKLGKWYDSKRNGRVGIKALWEGWSKLVDLVEAYEDLVGFDL